MASTAQILANRENARHSTGPKTEEGKTASARNAVRHGLTARGLIVPLGLESVFAEFESQLRKNLMPSGALQELLFMRILESAWNIERCRRAQATLFAQSADQGVDPLLDDQIEAKFARIDKYARQYESSMYKAMRELGKLQTEVQVRKEIRSKPVFQNEAKSPAALLEKFTDSAIDRSISPGYGVMY